MKKTRRKNQSGETRAYLKSAHSANCPLPGTKSHSGRCADQEVSEKSESVRTRRPRSQAKPEVKKSGRGNSTKRTTRGRRVEKAEPIALGDLDNQPNEAFIYEVDEGVNIVGFDGSVATNTNYGKFSYADESSYDDGDVVLHRREFMDFQVHNDALGNVEDGDNVTILIVPNVEGMEDITLGDIFNQNNHWV